MLTKRFLKNFKIRIITDQFIHARQTRTDTKNSKKTSLPVRRTQKIDQIKDVIVAVTVHSLDVLNNQILSAESKFLPVSEITDLKVQDMSPDMALDILEKFFKLNSKKSKKWVSFDLISIFVNQITHKLDLISLEHFHRLLNILNITHCPECDRLRRIETVNTVTQSFFLKLTNDLKENKDIQFLSEALTSNYDSIKKLLKVFLKREQKMLFYEISLEQAINLLTILCKMDENSTEYVEFYMLVELIILKYVNFVAQTDLEFLLRQIRLKNVGLDNKHYNRYLIDRIVNRLVTEDVGFYFGLNCLSSLNSMRHTNKSLLNYLSSKYFEMSSISGKNVEGKSNLSVLIHGLALAQYKPYFWKDLLTFFESSKILQLDHLTLCQIAQNLACLNYHNIQILEKIFSPQRTYWQSSYFLWAFCKLWQYLKTLPEYNGPMPTEGQIRALSFLKDIKRSSYPVQNCLTSCVGGPEFIATDMWSRLYHRIDHVVSLKPNGDFFKINPDKKETMSKMCMDDLDVPEDCKKILVVMSEKFWYSRNKNELLGPFAMYYQTLNALKVPVIYINCLEWDCWSEDKRRAFFKQEIDKLVVNIYK